MIINSIHIKKFRGFIDVRFKLGSSLTVIAGQNGTQKTTLLGIISQPFTITDKKNPLYGEKPLSGGNYKSLFSEKFKLSETFDLPKGHEWTLNLSSTSNPEFTIESIERKDKSGSKGIRFWKKGDRSVGSGYIQMPVIYLSLSRLLPIGEDRSIKARKNIPLTADELDFYQEWHNKILLIPDVEMTGVDYLASKQKDTLGANTAFYDWKMNSAGQDNLGKILLAILSFKRMKETHGTAYQGGILVIDEIDATLYPASQLKLIDALRKFSSKYDIQVIFTTHSLIILQKACEWQENKNISGQTRVIFLKKLDASVKAIEDISFLAIKDNLNVVLSKRPIAKGIPVFTEDKEAEIFLKAIIKRKSSFLKFVDCTLGCDQLIELAKKKIVGFKYPQSIIVLDGDVRAMGSKMRKINKLKNFIVLPGSDSPERLIAEFLHSLLDESPYWNAIHECYSKQFVFSEFTIREIRQDRNKAKLWFNSQKEFWGRNCVKVINPWIKENKNEVESFIEEYDSMIQKYYMTPYT